MGLPAGLVQYWLPQWCAYMPPTWAPPVVVPPLVWWWGGVPCVAGGSRWAILGGQQVNSPLMSPPHSVFALGTGNQPEYEPSGWDKPVRTPVNPPEHDIASANGAQQSYDGSPLPNLASWAVVGVRVGFPAGLVHLVVSQSLANGLARMPCHAAYRPPGAVP